MLREGPQLGGESDFGIRVPAPRRTATTSGRGSDYFFLFIATRDPELTYACILRKQFAISLAGSWASRMERSYHIFEIIGGHPIWRKCVNGHATALFHAIALAAKSTNEIRIMHLPDNALVAVLNNKQSSKLDRQAHES